MSEEPHDFYLIMASHEIFSDDAQYAGEMKAAEYYTSVC